VKILISTLFDCTTTGVVGRYREERGRFQDHSGQWIESQEHWERARNQQRNYETLVQVLSLRTQLDNITASRHDNNTWSFSAVTDREGVFGPDFAALLDDCDNVPMIPGMLAQGKLPACLQGTGEHPNVWFQQID
jgi:hypothetical protein